ncbi:MAG: asparagine synthase (glutamine-hydrolyzing) [Geminicoccaceae bacterium]
MCGIAGWVSEAAPVDRADFDRMTDSLAHRGPDGRGIWYARGDRVALGHRRLAIVDLTASGAQPMRLQEAGLTLTFNGEIYNHPDLRRQLEAQGHVYRSRCDAETILHAYAEWGADCVTRFRGIFAFAIWDEARGRLFAARDHLGVKPFYYRHDPTALAFASQPRAFLELSDRKSDIGPDAFADYLLYGVVPGERCLFSNVKKLPPAHALEWQDGAITTHCFWRPPHEADILDGEAARRAIENELEEVIGAQLMSDVPVATMLSGGIDSSLITAIAVEQSDRPVRAFTLGFDDDNKDERAYAALTAKRCGVEQIVDVLSAERIEAITDQVVEAYDEPFGINACLPMIDISRLIAVNGAKVILTGDGADELFAGYRHYDDLTAHYRKWGRETAAADGQRFSLRGLTGRRFTPFTVYRAHNGWLTDKCAAAVAGPALRETPFERWREQVFFPEDRGPVEAGRRCDLATYLPDEILVKVDRATMAYGVEARVPFLDPRLVELAFRISPELHYANGERKALLKSVAARWLPADILTARKKGFSAPIAGLLIRDAAHHAQMLDDIASGPLAANGFLKSSQVALAVRQSPYPAAALLQLYFLDRWARRWVWPVHARSPAPAL